MINPFNRLLDRQEQQGAGADLLLATVAAVTSGGLTLIPDGETEATQKKYKYMTSAYPAPEAGDRVVVMRLSGTYVVLGRIGASTPAADQYVHRSGDTMTGNLIMKNGTYVATDSSSQQVGVRPESNTATNNFFLRDKIQAVFGRIRGYFGTDGRVGIQLLTERTVDGTNTINQLGLYVDEAGERTVSVTSAQAWRKALGLELDTTPTAGSANVVTSGGIKTALDGKVSKTGDTMTGDLHMLDAAHYMDSDEITIGTRPESNKWSKRIAFRDSARKTFARVQGYQGANGSVGIQLIGEQPVNGENKTNYLGLYVSDDGNSVVDISSAAWRKALGLGTDGALPLTIAQGGSGDTQTVRETTIANVATAGANVTLTQTLFCRWGKLAMIEINGNATADIAAGSTVFTLVSGKRPALDSSAQVWRSTTYVSTIHPDGTAVLVGSTLSSGSGFTILACYLLA